MSLIDFDVVMSLANIPQYISKATLILLPALKKSYARSTQRNISMIRYYNHVNRSSKIITSGSMLYIINAWIKFVLTISGQTCCYLNILYSIWTPGKAVMVKEWYSPLGTVVLPLKLLKSCYACLLPLLS